MVRRIVVKVRIIHTVFYLFLILGNAFSQNARKIAQPYEKINWKPTSYTQDPETGKSTPNFNFTNAEFKADNNFSPYFQVYRVSDPGIIYEAELTVIAIETVTEQERKSIDENWKNI